MGIFDTCQKRVESKIEKVFQKYGELVGKHPLPFIILPILIFGGLGAGLLRMDEETDMEKVYFPQNSPAIEDRQVVRDIFPDVSNQFYNVFSLSDPDRAVTLLFRSKENIFSNSSVSEIAGIISGVKNLKGSGKMFGDFCAKMSSRCVVEGEFALTPSFRFAVANGNVTYPVWNGMDLASTISGTELSGQTLMSATVLRVSFKLAEEAKDWTDEFLAYAETLDPENIEVAYETPASLSKELDKSTKGDIVFFSLTITLCCCYASVVTASCNCVSTRSTLAMGGILAAGLGIVGSMGLLSLCGVKYVSIVGVIPFLIIGIGIDDMFLVMSSWSQSLVKADERSVPEILGKTLASAGIGITITSLTDFLAFVIGITSVFMCVKNFCLYAGVAVIFCYLANITLFSGCLAYHGRRVYSSRHFFTCRKTSSRETLEREGSAFHAFLCGGTPPEKERDDESFLESIPRKALPFLTKHKCISISVIFLFVAYLSVAIFGTTRLEQGLVLRDLVMESSYYHKFLTFSEQYFPTRLPVGFVVRQKIDYEGHDGTAFLNLLQKARNDNEMDSNFERCWLSAYRRSTFYNPGSSQDFVRNLQLFLNNTPDFKGDVVLDTANSAVTSSRCFLFSAPNNDQYKNAHLMEKLRELADSSALPVFAYHSSFVAYEQYLQVLPGTLQLVGCAMAAVTVVTFIFLPHLPMVLLVMLTVVMILVGIFGFMHFWNLTLSSVTMIHLVMSVGFSVDFSVHVCTAYLISKKESRQERAEDAISHAAGPIMNGGVSTLMGILLLLASSSFIFQSFFKVMLLVIVFGMMHAALFLPAVLSLFGPQNILSSGAKVNEENNNAKDNGDLELQGKEQGKKDKSDK